MFFLMLSLQCYLSQCGQEVIQFWDCCSCGYPHCFTAFKFQQFLPCIQGDGSLRGIFFPSRFYTQLPILLLCCALERVSLNILAQTPYIILLLLDAYYLCGEGQGDFFIVLIKLLLQTGTMFVGLRSKTISALTPLPVVGLGLAYIPAPFPDIEGFLSPVFSPSLSGFSIVPQG